MKKQYFIFVLMVILLFASCDKKSDTVRENNSTNIQETPSVTGEVNETPDRNPEGEQEPASGNDAQTNDDTKLQDNAKAGDNTQKTDDTKPAATVPQGDIVDEKIICIDPGHQAHQNSDLEPIGPGADEKKPKVSSGTQGKYTGKPEYEVNLEVSLKLKEILVNKGYKVIMIRETHDVNISNSERAQVANDSNADVFVRIHCNGAENPDTHGILTMCSTKDNPYCGQFYEKSRRLSDSILKQLCDITGAKDMGVIETDSMSGINWCQVPVTIVEMGYMTNKEEDYKLSGDEYQKKLAEGIAEGITEYLDNKAE
ncbi:N-acetylmuramoyl-L-alanine amidase family protein [Anaerocolumna xylanovorans]|uniref:N-acetylmuramoyl-L-alanine amidase n=1 Tax=Anaerocolumna xylanovorans DSM 12503 TaxID=1121345 RepID=A0A1M7Y490_9FIRM|nr:N-acetylmuramoyl-L-alanine amidase [Anaerocolumna xylanovorans]SHO47104.1 N-acetylmuramoyl-L-alanine amidase [Anaerocolumna xylanovorans DSM 12503]